MAESTAQSNRLKCLGQKLEFLESLELLEVFIFFIKKYNSNPFGFKLHNRKNTLLISLRKTSKEMVKMQIFQHKSLSSKICATFIFEFPS